MGMEIMMELLTPCAELRRYAEQVARMPAPVMPPTADHFKSAVAHGAGFLDSVLEQPWRPEIHIPTLSLADGGCCVLGQLFGDYGDGCRTLKLSPPQSRLYGFSVGHGYAARGGLAGEYAAWGALTEAWRRELAPA